MKHATAALLLIVAVATFAQTPNAGSKRGSQPTEQVVIGLEKKWVDALMKSDPAALDSILADTYVDTDEGGHRSDKQGVLSALKSGDLKIASIKLSDMHANVYGKAAVVTGNAAQAGTFKGQRLAASILFTDTFVLQNGKWRAVASHRTVAP